MTGLAQQEAKKVPVPYQPLPKEVLNYKDLTWGLQNSKRTKLLK